MGRPRKNQDDSSDLLGDDNQYSTSETIVESSQGGPPSITVEEPKKLVVDMSRWREIDSSARSGLPYFVSDTAIGDGILAFYRRTRAFANAAKRWKNTGKFVDFTTGVDLIFQPLYFRNRFE